MAKRNVRISKRIFMLHSCSARMAAISKFQLHVHSPLDRIRTIGRDLGKSQVPIQCYCVLHDRLNRIEAHATISDCAGFPDDSFSQSAPSTLPSKLRTQIQAFHLADMTLKLMQRDASGEGAVVFRQ